jgi:hypothetical protein
MQKFVAHICHAHWMLLLSVLLDRDDIVVDAPGTIGVISTRNPSKEIAMRAKGSAKIPQSLGRARREGGLGNTVTEASPHSTLQVKTCT